MIRQLRLEGFSAVPYLATSALMKHHGNEMRFSLDKPTVIVGPNGSGKSALLMTLAIRFLAFLTGESAFDRQYVNGGADRQVRQQWWTSKESWRHEHEFLKGLLCETDNAPTLYYRPRHVPGNEASSTHALMMGYAKEAREYAAQTEQRSSGEANAARLRRALAILQGKESLSFGHVNWTYGKEPRELNRVQGWVGDSDYRAEVLKHLFASPGPQPLVLLDEPEQSLDTLEEAKLWKSLDEAHGAQVIIATHSLHPLLHPERFSIIETVPGYSDKVRDLI